jgi:hypothetical protein
VLPRAPRSARVIGRTPGWEEGLREAGIVVAGDGGPWGTPDLVVADRGSAAQALAAGTEMVVVEGRTTRRSLRSGGHRVERYLPWPGAEAPEVLLPLDQPRAVRYAIRQWTVPTRRWKRARNAVLVSLLDRGAVPPLRIISVGARSAGPPFMVRAACEEFELPSDPGWFLTLGEGDALTRGVFQLFEPEASEPAWVLKFARLPGNTEPFDRDQRGLELVQGAGGPLADHAPRLLGRFEAEGLPASLETAAAGRRMNLVLRAPGDRGVKLRAVEAVAAWLLEVAQATRSAPERLEPERRRLTEDVLPHWTDQGAEGDLVTSLGETSAVFEHRDLGSWNLVAAGGTFTAVDWESSLREGFPLWDLLYFLTDALAHLDGASPLERRVEHAARLHRGELGSSAILFAWVRRIVDALAITPQSVGRLATLCWLHHGVSHISRRAAAESVAPNTSGLAPYLDGIARLWLTDRALGPGWEAWRR